MQILSESLSLSRRIVISVALGLGLILLLFGIVVLWTTQESTEAAYRARVVLAETLSNRADDMLGYWLGALEREARVLQVEPDRPLTDDQQLRLATLRLQSGVFVTLAVADSSGTIIWSASDRADIRVGGPLRHPSVTLAFQNETPQIVEFSSDRDGQRVFVCLAVPLRGADGTVVGVLMGQLDPSHPELALLPRNEIGDGLHVQLVNTSGHVIAGPQPSSSDAAEQHRALLAELMETQTAGYRIHQSNPWDTFGSHLVAYAPLSRLPSWGIIVEQPEDLALALPNQLRWRLALLGLAALLVTISVAWFDVRRVVRPLKDLTVAAERFAEGKLDEPVRVDQTDELGILANAFETMRQRLCASLDEVAAWNRDLEQRVASRTAEVERLNEHLQARERERAELLQRIMAAQEDERRRVAQELHDETSQALASLRLGLERLAEGITKPPSAQMLAEQLQAVASETLADVHRLAVELRPSVLDDVGLFAAVSRYLQECGRRWELAIDFLTIGVDGLRLLPSTETVVYRIIQAALTNVAHHAGAEHVSVLFERRDGALVVVVEDDGRGFDLERVRAAPLEQRLGLAGMEERAALVAATLTIETAPNSGTTVFLEIPLESNARREAADATVAHPAC